MIVARSARAVAPRLRRGAPRCAAALVLVGLLGSGLPTAGASPIGDARQRAAALRAKVDQLQHQAEVATEAYDAAYADLGKAVTAHLTAERDLELAQQASGGADALATRRVRALYMSGGTAALYAGVLTSASITEVAQRVHQVDLVLSGDRHAVQLAGDAVAHRRDAERRLAQSAAASTRLQ
ncbi:MAG: hypothetical protein WCD35_16040, partial [Mycobacteriales bacterium]